MIEASKLRAGMTFVTNDGKLLKVLKLVTTNLVKVTQSCV